MNLSLFLISSILIISLAVPVAVYATVLQTPTDPQHYPVCGSKSGAVAGTVTKFIQMGGLNALSIIVNATGGNLGANNLVVGVSNDNSTYLTVDTISMGSATIKGISYSNALKATTVTVNPASYPWVKVATSAGVSSVTETLYWCAGLS